MIYRKEDWNLWLVWETRSIPGERLSLDIHQSPISRTLKREEPLHTSVSLVHPTQKFCNSMQFEGLFLFLFVFDIGISFWRLRISSVTSLYTGSSFLCWMDETFVIGDKLPLGLLWLEAELHSSSSTWRCKFDFVHEVMEEFGIVIRVQVQHFEGAR